MKIVSKGIMRVNIIFLVLFLVFNLILFLKPHKNVMVFPASRLIHDYTTKMMNERISNKISTNKTHEILQAPSLLQFLINDNVSIGVVNMGENELRKWGLGGVKYTNLTFERVSTKLKWEHLFPYWVDEHEIHGVPKCPEVPLPDFSEYGNFDVAMAKLPCEQEKEGWNRDVFRLQVHLVVTKLAVQKARRSGKRAVKMVFLSKCEPMRDIFRCDDLVRNEGEWWIYDAEVVGLEEKLRLPIGSCELAFAENKELDTTKPYERSSVPYRREAYATVLHSSEAYICGVITLAYTLRKTGTTRDLILLHDSSIYPDKLHSLISAGWAPRLIERIRNPHAKKGTHNGYNFTKFRLWQLTDYDKIIFIDSDIIVLKNIDFLFGFPKMSACGDGEVFFNSGLVVLEPSNCTFETMISNIESVISYNGGDQGFLNEMFVWWHRLPHMVNYLKMNTSQEIFNASIGTSVYTIHYVGMKPWRCYRDYDCNWDLEWSRMFANDEAFFLWWKIFDEAGEVFKSMCNLSEEDIHVLERNRKYAESIQYSDQHWKINITDPRKEAYV